MAQLPPKSPPTWPTLSSAAALHASWADDFLDFSSAKRGAHRRAMSDSIAFFELIADPPEPAHNATVTHHSSSDFERLDDDQLISMFAAGDQPSPTAAPSTSDHNSVTELNPPDPPAPSEEAQSSYDAEPSTENTAPPPAAEEERKHPIVDPKRVKRILANRQSAQRSRVRKLQYISELERSVTTLQTEVSALSPRVAFLDHQRSILTVGNSHLKQRIAALAQDKLFKDAHQEALKNEIERLRQVYRQQSLKKVEAMASDEEAAEAHEVENLQGSSS
ncbi:hypothetical protein HPP92_019853 [Vanilla planifolia]|uniref:BZIP domain-containing protein n=1 Tax=Vanilla planifolia TaxID=51239 RepID=A0A835Q9S8_VANPL|nr:hypothetical protein HPP92_020291 [Vanilla planifolia]KAG0465689.1 hypothetical protein HPP92_019853 [Vanilla planifolia]